MPEEKIISTKLENIPAAVDPVDLAQLLKTNLDQNQEILRLLREVKKYIYWQQIWNICRLILIFVPIILGFIYLPPLVKDVVSIYRAFLNN